MRGGRGRAAAVVALIAVSVAACGGGDKEQAPTAKGKVLRGETETGMKLEVETFVDPAKDPRLKQLDAYRAQAGYGKVDYHRITADNTKGQLADRDRTVTFAESADAIATGQGIDPRFACDVLRYEWLPRKGGVQTTEQAGLRKSLCPVAPDTPDSIAPGQRQVYYLVTDRSFAERGLDRLRVFGPRSAELHAAT